MNLQTIIPVGGLLPAGSSNLDDVFRPFNSISLRKKENEVMLKFMEDPIALSVTSNRLRFSESPEYFNITNSDLPKYITNDDRIIANNIRDYYSKKIMMFRLLNDRPLTPFREDLANILHNTDYILGEDKIGMVYYLPYFYFYDIQLDEIKATFKEPVDISSPMFNHIEPVTRVLTPYKEISLIRRNTKQIQFWFTDTETSKPVMIDIENHNPLLKVWQRLFRKSTKMLITGKYHCQSMENFKYITVKNWDLDI